MKKVKRILAAAGAILLLLLYASTLVCALSSSENFMNLLMVSIYATVIIPVLLWAYTLIYKLVHKSSEEDAEQKEPPQGQKNCLRNRRKTIDVPDTRDAEILNTKCGISNPARRNILDDPCLSKLGALHGLCPQAGRQF